MATEQEEILKTRMRYAIYALVFCGGLLCGHVISPEIFATVLKIVWPM